MSRQMITINDHRGGAQERPTHNHIVTTCMIPFGNGNKARAIASLRKLANHMGRCDLSVNKNLYAIYSKSLSNKDNFSKVFMGFDSPPLYASPEWMNFQPKYKGPRTPIIDTMFHHSSAGILSFMTDDQDSLFVHMHELGQGHSVKCTSPVCRQQYEAKAIENRHAQEYSKRFQTQKRKRNSKNKASIEGISITDRRRIRFNKKTFKALCDEWERGFKVRTRFPDRPTCFTELPMDLKVMIWDLSMPQRTVIVNPYFLPGCQKILRLESKIQNSVLFGLNHESRKCLRESLCTIHLVDSNGPTGFYLNAIKDTILLLSLGFLRTRSLSGFDQIAEPFSRVRKLAIPWTSACWSATHVAFMPSIFRSLETLTVLGFDEDLSIVAHVANWGEQIELFPAPADFRHYREMAERQEWIRDAFQRTSRSISTRLMIVTKAKKEETAAEQIKRSKTKPAQLIS